MDYRSTVGLSFAFSMMVTSAFVSTAPEGFISAGSGPAMAALTAAAGDRGSAIKVHAPTSAPAPRETADSVKVPFLTDAQIEKLLRFSERRELSMSMDEDIAEQLRLRDSKGYRAIRFRLNDTYQHFTRLPGDSAFLFGYDTTTETKVFRIERDARLTRAVVKRGTTPAKVMALSDAAAEVNAVIELWSRAANSLKDS